MRSQNGNVLFLILIAVALFAALSYAVTSSSRGGGNGTSTEDLAMATSQILQYGAAMKTAVLRMKISGVADTDFCFANAIQTHTLLPNVNTNYLLNPGCSDPRNNVFDPAGGGMALLRADPKWLKPSWQTNGYRDFYWYSSGTAIAANGLDTNAELMMALDNIRDDICLEINKQTYGGTSIASINPGGNPFTGTYTATGFAWPISGYSVPTSFCISRTNFSPSNMFVQILIQR